MNTTTLPEAFAAASYPLSGHGRRNLHVLQEVLDSLDGELASDMYGSGQIIEDFERDMAKYLGKESAVFFPSGTMAQQIALRIWCDRQNNRSVAYHPLCHLEIHEQDGLKELHHIEPILLGTADRLLRIEDVKNIGQPIACLLLELPQREIGGQLPPYEELEAISAYCRQEGIKLHLDGARLPEIIPYYQKSAAEISALFDSVYISFYKGIGGIAGAILAGEQDFTTESKVWKRRHGGDLISLYPYIVSSAFYFKQREPKMAQYYAEAQELATLYNSCHGVNTLPIVPVSNMFHVHIQIPKHELEPLLISFYKETGVALTSYLNEKDNGVCSFEVSTGDRYAGIPQDLLKSAFKRLNEMLELA
ncbi:threonine aldolase [Paenibacillus shirakamiensis]|uniref:Threonine aldolase n=1 Tax=Paenibacillus shirakamiensis TaxID=1265935 RepID=A0ABS4JIG7_9BACL|nr:beta-eliminating lyase-related protein [Paenibacillus shirakamiensis]MBP2001493.1 threonine aldolase [Paenibacillus shirakamiensis]